MLHAETDEEMKAMAREEIAELEARETRLIEDLKVLLLPRDPNDDRNVIVEIRAGAGGEEAALFANELLRMYFRYAKEHRFHTELMSLNETGIGGIKEAILEVAGDGAYSRFKFEGGVHRVQRVPSTEIAAAGSTPPPRRSSSCPRRTRSRSRSTRSATSGSTSSARPGPGGQSVNTTDSAVRITHLPDRPRRRDPGREEPAQEQGQGDGRPALAACTTSSSQSSARRDSATRRSMVQAGDRSEKIRTYNFPQNRVTDHRIGTTIHNVPGVLDGQLDPLIDALVMADQADRLGTSGADDGAADRRPGRS